MVYVGAVLFGIFVLSAGYTLSILMIARDFNLFILIITNFPMKKWSDVAVVVEEDDRLDSSIKYDKVKFLELVEEHSF